MQRYFSHYTFIYPDIYLKNYIVEMDDDGHFVRYFPFEKEIEKTEFHSGLLMFMQKGINVDKEILFRVQDKLLLLFGSTVQDSISEYDIINCNI